MPCFSNPAVLTASGGRNWAVGKEGILPFKFLQEAVLASIPYYETSREKARFQLQYISEL